MERIGAGSKYGTEALADADAALFTFSTGYEVDAKLGRWLREYIGKFVGSSFSMVGAESRIACSGTARELRLAGLASLSFLGLSPRSMLDVLNLTFPDGERGGVMMLSSGSSGIGLVGKAGSEAGAVEEVSLSPDSDATSSVVFDFRKLTTRFFFFRLACDRERRPAPR